MFAKRVYKIAGWFGLAELSALLLFEKATGNAMESVMYYGFLLAALTWQFVFLLIASDPIKYRSVMPIAMAEKACFVAEVIVVEIFSRLPNSTLAFASIDFIWLLLFAAVYYTNMTQV